MGATIWGAKPIIDWINTAPILDNGWLTELARKRAGQPVQMQEHTLQADTATLGQTSRSDPAYQSVETYRHDGSLESASNPASSTSNEAVGQLSPDALRQVRELSRIDRNVRAHEAAHLSAASGIAVSGMQFGYTRGPDGVRYATSGEVSIDTSAVANDPEATYRKALQILAAALAPSDPSPQDRRVAALATQMAANAQIEMARQRLQPSEDGTQKISSYLAIQGLRPDQSGTSVFA